MSRPGRTKKAHQKKGKADRYIWSDLSEDDSATFCGRERSIIKKILPVLLESVGYKEEEIKHICSKCGVEKKSDNPPRENEHNKIHDKKTYGNPSNGFSNNTSADNDSVIFIDNVNAGGGIEEKEEDKLRSRVLEKIKINQSEILLDETMVELMNKVNEYLDMVNKNKTFLDKIDPNLAKIIQNMLESFNSDITKFALAQEEGAYIVVPQGDTMAIMQSQTMFSKFLNVVKGIMERTKLFFNKYFKN